MNEEKTADLGRSGIQNPDFPFFFSSGLELKRSTEEEFLPPSLLLMMLVKYMSGCTLVYIGETKLYPE